MKTQKMTYQVNLILGKNSMEISEVRLARELLTIQVVTLITIAVQLIEVTTQV